MKLKPTVILATFVVALGLLLGTGAAQAATVNFDPDDSSRAIGITDLDIGGTIYDVDFVGPTEAVNVYGELPGDFEFTTLASAAAAVDAVNAALNAAGGVKYVGPEGGANDPFAGVYDVGWSTDTVIGVPFANNVEGFVASGGTWAKRSSPDQSVYNADSRTWATFTAAEGVAPGKATLISPSGTLSENAPTYTWNAVESANWYRLQVDDSAGAKAVFEWVSADDAGCGGGTGECSVTPSTELADGDAVWWIQTNNDFGNGPWSDALSFTVDTGTGALPGQATLISPSGTITDDSPSYTWNAVANATWYYLWVSDIAGNNKRNWYSADEAGCGGGTGECSVTPAFMLADDSYNWWILTNNDAGDGPWSDGLSFTVDTGTGSTLPGQATLISPSGTITDNAPTYTWNAVENATWYRLQVDDSAGAKAVFQWVSADDAGCGGGTGECSATPTTELADGAAVWWIQTNNEFGDGPWSDALSFTVDTGTGVALGQATLISPNGTITDNTPTYTWNAVANATWYYLCVEDLAGNEKKKWYSADQAGCGGGAGDCSVTPEFLLADDSFNWWIQTYNDAGDGPWSAGLFFTVGGGREAEVIFDPNDSSRAIGITNLSIDGTLANVEFTTITEAANVYGELPGDFDFTTSASAAAAVDAVNAALNAEGGVEFVGAEGEANLPLNRAFDVGWSSEETALGPITNLIESTVVSGTWERRDPNPPDTSVYFGDSRTWATFTVAE